MRCRWRAGGRIESGAGIRARVRRFAGGWHSV